MSKEQARLNEGQEQAWSSACLLYPLLNSQSTSCAVLMPSFSLAKLFYPSYIDLAFSQDLLPLTR